MQDLVVEEGGSVELVCQYSRPVHAMWKMNAREVCADGHRVIIEQDWTVARLIFRPALPHDSGIYSCEAEGTCTEALLQVRGEAAWRALVLRRPGRWEQPVRRPVAECALGGAECVTSRTSVWLEQVDMVESE